MSEHLQPNPERPPNNLASALEFLLDEGGEWLWEDGGIDIAKLLYDIACSLDDDQIKELQKLVDLAKEGLPSSILGAVNDMQTSGIDTSKAIYLASLEDIIRNIDTPSLLSINALRLAADLHIEQMSAAVQDV